MDAQVFHERIGDNPARAMNVAPPDDSPIATIELREGFLYVARHGRAVCSARP